MWGVHYRVLNLCFCFSVLSLTETVTTLPSLEWQRRLKSMSMVQSFRMQWIFTTLRMKWPVIPKSGRHWFVFELRVPFSLDCLCGAIVLLSWWELEGKGGMQELMEVGWHEHCYLCVPGSSKVVTKPIHIWRRKGNREVNCSCVPCKCCWIPAQRDGYILQVKS